CTAKSAKRYGAQGKVYKNVCPPELEERFMTPYREGRQIYLRGMVADKNKQILHLDGKIRQATRDRDRLSLQISGFRVLKTWVVKDVRDPRTGKVVRQRALEPDPRSLNERNRLQNSLNIRNNQIRDFEAKQEQLRMEVDTLNQELRALQVSQ
ncbi:MAG: DUF2799 domain-containing protein, partial [Bdellovibrionales bacterium]|nr:DUF2799 domain-containing protein [Bdellovibrionales bacterium]